MVIRNVILAIAVVVMIAISTAFGLKLLMPTAEQSEYRQAFFPMEGTIRIGAEQQRYRLSITGVDSHQLSEFADINNIKRLWLTGPDGDVECTWEQGSLPAMSDSPFDVYLRSLAVDILVPERERTEVDTLGVEFVTGIVKEYPIGSLLIERVADHFYQCDDYLWSVSGAGARRSSHTPVGTPSQTALHILLDPFELCHETILGPPEVRIVDIDLGCDAFGIDAHTYLVIPGDAIDDVFEGFNQLNDTSIDLEDVEQPWARFATASDACTRGDLDIDLEFSTQHTRYHTTVVVRLAYLGDTRPASSFIMSPRITLEMDGNTFEVGYQMPLRAGKTMPPDQWRAFLLDHGI